jgi:hypothetical protein
MFRRIEPIDVLVTTVGILAVILMTMAIITSPVLTKSVASDEGTIIQTFGEPHPTVFHNVTGVEIAGGGVHFVHKGQKIYLSGNFYVFW